MCLSPRYITNRTLHYDLFKPLKMQVPCGKCEECRSMNRNEWFTRCYYEWLRNRNNTFFYTLTYNNDNLPKFKGVSHFSKRHVQTFLKRLRFRLNKLDIKLKYMICCEFGEKLHRPHYHALFFVDKNVNPYWFLRFVTDSWKYGFVQSGDNVGVVNSPSGIQYVTKYVTKDMSQVDLMLPIIGRLAYNRYKVLENYVVKRWDLDIKATFFMNSDFSVSRKKFLGCTQNDLDFVQKFLTKIRRMTSNVLPFHLQSTRLGSNIIQYCDKDLEQVPILNGNGSISMSKVPRYIKRMLWYDCVEGENSHKRDTFVLNEVGKLHYFDMLPLKISKTQSDYECALKNASSVDASIITQLKDKGFDFQHNRDLVFWAQHFDLDTEVLAIYKNVFRGRVNFLGDFDLNAQFVKDSWKDYAEYCLYSVPQLDFGKICSNQSIVTALNACLWNLHPYFQVYEEAIQILDEVIFTHRKYQSALRIAEEEKRKQLRQVNILFNS